MSQKQLTFGDRLRSARAQAKDPKTRRPLSQKRLVELMAQHFKLEEVLTPQTISLWETNQNQPKPGNRDMLLALIAALLQCGGLANMTDANTLLAAGGYALLSESECREVGVEFLLPVVSSDLPVLAEAVRSAVAESVERFAPAGPLPITPRSVFAPTDEIAAATALLDQLPTDRIPEPEDVLPPGSWMAQLRRNHQFVGREADLRDLAVLLKGGQSVAVNQGQSAVASGLGGIGKTQLAIEFAYRYGRYFAGVFWMNFAQPDTIPTEFARLGGAGQLQLFTEGVGLKVDEQVGLVRGRLASGLPYLLIFDNCEDPELVRSHHPGGASRVLITSRRPDWPGDLGIKALALDVLKRDESIALLRQHRSDLSSEDAQAIAEELGYLPLALHLAGRFLAGPGKRLTAARYLEELRSPRIFERLPLRAQDGTLPTGYRHDVARTFALSYERLDPEDAEGTLALRLLARAAYLVPGEVIPADLLQETLEGDQDDLDVQLTTEAALEQLISLGLLEREGDDGLLMHRLVGAYVRQVSVDANAQVDVERVVVGIAKNLVDAPTLAPLATFLPLLRGVTDLALVRKDKDAVTLCIWLERHLDRLGAYHAAQPYLERALAISEHVLGTEHPETATILNNLAGLLESQGNYTDARPLYERALALRERVLGTEHPQTAQSFNNLAYLLERQGNYEAARLLYERAVRISERVLGPEHPETATALSNLAGLLERQGNYEAACMLYEHVLALRERVLGPEHPETAHSLNNLAGVFRAQGNYDAARPLYERALRISKDVLGLEHPQTATGLNNLAGLLERQKDYQAAHPLYAQALALRERVLGPEHPDTAQSLNNLAYVLARQGNYESARSLYERALALRERILGPEHPDTAQSLNNLAHLNYSEGKLSDARPLFERALAVRERVLGPEHPDTASSLNNLAIYHYYHDELITAERLIRRALEIRELRLGPDHPDTQSSRRSLAVIQQHRIKAIPSPPNTTNVLAPLLAAIATVAAGNQARRGEVEQALAQLEQQGCMLRGPVERIWVGERDRDALVADLDEQDTALIQRVLALVGEYQRGERETPAQALAAMPDEIRVAIEAGDGATLMETLGALPEAERQAIIARLARAGVIQEPPPRPPSANEQQIAELRAQAERAVAQVLSEGDEQQRAALGTQLGELALRVEEGEEQGSSWLELATYLRALRSQLGQ